MKKRGRQPALTPEEVDHVRDLYKNSSCSFDRIAAHFHVSQTTIIRIIERKPPYNYQGVSYVMSRRP